MLFNNQLRRSPVRAVRPGRCAVIALLRVSISHITSAGLQPLPRTARQAVGNAAGGSIGVAVENSLEAVGWVPPAQSQVHEGGEIETVAF